ncbi:hypothetical protein J6590_048889 [Homalodisca vitripennis]|nr:hypothetical protein J6590_048889 [Homalodisca vitripennis]
MSSSENQLCAADYLGMPSQLPTLEDQNEDPILGSNGFKENFRSSEDNAAQLIPLFSRKLGEDVDERGTPTILTRRKDEHMTPGFRSHVCDSVRFQTLHYQESKMELNSAFRPPFLTTATLLLGLTFCLVKYDR